MIDKRCKRRWIKDMKRKSKKLPEDNVTFLLSWGFLNKILKNVNHKKIKTFIYITINFLKSTTE